MAAHPFDLSALLVDPHQALAHDPRPHTGISPIRDALKIVYVPSTIIGQFLNDAPGHVLGMMRYGTQASVRSTSSDLSIHVAMPQIGEMELVEVWLSRTPVSLDQTRPLSTAGNGEFLLGCWECGESPEVELDHLVCAAYEHILAFCETAGYQNLFRMWNYFPAINTEQDGLERYKRFCVGRHKAFAARFSDLQSVLPAASAVGTQGGPVQIVFLAGKQPGTHIENPRQVSAYHYPSVYGPQSPSFARATMVGSSKAKRLLYVAGTASIVGHATQHVGDPAKQTSEILSNIEKLLQQSTWDTTENFHNRASPDLLKVYMRLKADLKQVQRVISAGGLERIPALFLIGDLCRKDLLVEIEGIWGSEEGSG
ncbi:MAG: hypothetical protein H0W49_11625 [Nitrospirales bacterium]|nr:hypothetical protein [Nitrospirales bacterium]